MALFPGRRSESRFKPSDLAEASWEFELASCWRTRQQAEICVNTKEWSELDSQPGYRGYQSSVNRFPIFLPFWDKRIRKDLGWRCGEPHISG